MQKEIINGRIGIKRCPKWMNYRFVVIVCYSAIVIVLMVFHEPWFDEAQAWLIARDSTLKELILVRPHYEGHPFFWHLLLRIPAKLGLPYEASIKSINFIFAFLVVYLILYHSPLQKPVKVILPFTYFFLYQYGVVSRPYAMLGCAIFATAIVWKKRAERPWRLSLSLIFLCATSAYGIAIAGGFGIVWLLEKIRLKSLFKEKRSLAAMIAVAVFAVLMIIVIFPASDTCGLDSTSHGYSYISNILLCCFMVPSEALFTSFSVYDYLTYQDFTPFEIIIGTLISLLVWYLLISFLHKRKTAGLFLLTYFLFLVIAARYLCVHHYGIVLYLMLTALWIGLDIKPIDDKYNLCGIWQHLKDTKLKNVDIKQLSAKSVSKLMTGRNLVILMLVCFTFVNAYWSLSAIVTDINYNYGYGRMLAEYISDNQLDTKFALAKWTIKLDDDLEVESMDTNYIYSPVVEANAYFDESLVENREDGMTYEEHRLADDEENEENIERLKSLGTPDVIYTGLYTMLVINDILELDGDYHYEYVGDMHKVWKNKELVDNLYIWVHN